MSVTQEEADTVQAVIRAFYDDSMARRFTSGTIKEQTLIEVANLLAATVDCTQWFDAVPNPQDLLMPTKNILKWARRLIKSAAKPFVTRTVKVSLTCQKIRANQFRFAIEMSLY